MNTETDERTLKPQDVVDGFAELNKCSMWPMIMELVTNRANSELSRVVSLADQGEGELRVAAAKLSVWNEILLLERTMLTQAEQDQQLMNPNKE